MPYEEIDIVRFELIVEELLHKTHDVDKALGPGNYSWEIGYKVEEMLKDELKMLSYYDFTKEFITIYGYPIKINRQHPWAVYLWRKV